MTITDIEGTKYSRLRARLKKAHDDFQFALDDYDGLPAQWDGLKKLFGDVVKAARYADTCIGGLDLPERENMTRCLVEVVTPFVEYWRDVIENGDDNSIDDIDGARLNSPQ
jgi:hypothetical protein